MITVPFYEMIDTDSEIWEIINKQKFPSLYPPNVLPDEIIENINSNFYYREIAYSSPERFLMQWWRLIKERAYTWIKLLESEQALRDDDMIYNYDLTEDSTDNRTGTGENSSTTTPNLKTEQTPDLLNTTNNIINNRSATATKTFGSETDNQIQRTNEMDTPDGITNDIDNYLTRAQKDTIDNNISNENESNAETKNTGNDKQIYRQTGTNTTRQTGTSTTTGQSSSTDNNTHHLRRFGNIGVMTSAQILGGYRDAQSYDAYAAIIFPECEQLFLHFVEMDEIDIW